VRAFIKVFEQARRRNWGYVPMSDGEVMEMARELKMVVDPEIVIIAEMDGKPIGASLSLPNFNKPLAAIKGRLFPFGFLRFMRDIKRLHEVRIIGVAALEEYRHLGVTAQLLLETIIRGMARGYNLGEASWVLEDNYMSNRTIEHALSPERYKTYRLFEKPLPP
jgi:hypothetical protein